MNLLYSCSVVSDLLMLSFAPERHGLPGPSRGAVQDQGLGLAF